MQEMNPQRNLKYIAESVAGEVAEYLVPFSSDAFVAHHYGNIVQLVENQLTQHTENEHDQTPATSPHSYPKLNAGLPSR